jgi:hypothetical protein
MAALNNGENMVASNQTIHEVVQILTRHLKSKLTQQQWIDLMGDLCMVQGNKSFVETMRQIANELKRNKVY